MFHNFTDAFFAHHRDKCIFGFVDGHNGALPERRDAHVEPRQMLLCDFHIHTNYSDGKLSVPEVIDFYGERGFDCICKRVSPNFSFTRRLKLSVRLTA